jgi:photosystem II stability/assembly factor-like uncharacterized protein
MRKRIGCILGVLFVAGLWALAAYLVFNQPKQMQVSDVYSWEKLGEPIPETAFFEHITVCPSGSILVANRYGIFRSKDKGKSWARTQNGIKKCYVHCLLVSRKGYIFAGTGGGLYRSSDYGDHWEPTNSGLPSSYITNLSEDLKGRIYTGSLPGEIYRSNDNGDHWKKIRKLTLTSYGITSVAVTHNGIIIAGDDQKSPIRSIDDGRTWEATHGWSSGIMQFPLAEYSSFIVAQDNRVYTGAEFESGTGEDARKDSVIMRSDDGGKNWSMQKTGMRSFNCNTIVLDSEGRLLVGTEYGLLISADGGKTWMDSGLRNRRLFPRQSISLPRIYSLCADSSGRVYALSSQGQVFVGTPNKH